MSAVLQPQSVISDLEQYFRRFPDVPREVIVKIELLSRGFWFTDAALAATKGSMVKSWRLFSYDRVSMDQYQRNEAHMVPEYIFIFQGPYDLRSIMVQMSMDPKSPYVVDVVEGRLVLTSGGEVICNVGYPVKPAYYAKSFPDGVKYNEIIS